MRLAVLGAGRVGLSLAAWTRAAGGEVTALLARSPARAATRAAELLDPPPPARPIETFVDEPVEADVLLIAVSDPALAEVADRLAARLEAASASFGSTAWPGARVVLHTSGLFDRRILEPLATCGLATGSLHPLCAFPSALAAPRPHAVYAVDGAPAALEAATHLAHAFGGRAVEIDGSRRLLYHAGATLAAGGVTTLLAVAEELVERLELPAAVIDGYLDLAQGALEAARTRRPVAAAITGPAARGDTEVVERQLQAFGEVAPEHAQLVRTLAESTRRQRCRSGNPTIDE